MQDYQERKQERIDRYRELADSARERSNDAYAASNRAVEGIPMGQPILVGHHSEGRHRNAIKRSHSAMDRSLAENSKAEYWERRADGAENSNAISSKDPEAVVKLSEKLEGMEQRQELMKAINKLLRKKKFDLRTPEGVQAFRASLVELVPNETTRENAVKVILGSIRCWGDAADLGFQKYELANNNGNMRRVKQRIEMLTREASREEQSDATIGEVTIRDNKDHGGVELHFPGKPSDEIRTKLKGRGWRWARQSKCWYKSVSGGGYAYESARQFAEEIAQAVQAGVMLAETGATR